MYETLRRLKRPLVYVMAALYIVAGILHFIFPDLYVQVIPPFIPFPMAMVYLSGIAEIGLGAMLLHPRTRQLAAWGIIAMLIAIFPANIYMATHTVPVEGGPAFLEDGDSFGRWVRLPFQALLIAWAYVYTKPLDDN